VGVPLLPLLFVGCGLLALAAEGFICLIMAAPYWDHLGAARWNGWVRHCQPSWDGPGCVRDSSRFPVAPVDDGHGKARGFGDADANRYELGCD
jgi:hypothetical protein